RNRAGDAQDFSRTQETEPARDFLSFADHRFVASGAGGRTNQVEGLPPEFPGWLTGDAQLILDPLSGQLACCGWGCAVIQRIAKAAQDAANTLVDALTHACYRI